MVAKAKPLQGHDPESQSIKDPFKKMVEVEQDESREAGLGLFVEEKANCVDIVFCRRQGNSRHPWKTGLALIPIGPV